ncbi:MAG: YwaF family protein [Candidatus Izemoplasmatales bacterium]
MLREFLIRFFTYAFDGGSGPTSYSDGLGEGAFGWRHFLWIGFVVLAAVLGSFYFRKRPKAERTFVTIFAISLFAFRLVHQTVRASIGVEVPWTQAFPFHMCTVLTFLLPLTIVFDWKAIKTPVYVLSIMGGVITVILGDYFDNRFLTMFALEGMSAHTLLILIPIYEFAAGRHRLELRDAWRVIAGILVLMGWATLANLVFYPDSGANYMYLMENALPFGTDKNYFLFYILIFLVFFAGIYAGPIARALRRRKTTTAAAHR